MFGEIELGDVAAMNSVPDVGQEEIGTVAFDAAADICSKLPKKEDGVGIDPITIVTIIIGLAQLIVAVIKYCDEKRVKRLVRRAQARPRGIAAMVLRQWFKGKMPKGTPVKELFPLAVEWGVTIADADEKYRLLKESINGK